MGTVTRLFDGLANVLTGRGTTRDRRSHNVWLKSTWTPDQIEAAYRSSWLHRKIIDIPAKDMTRAGRDWDGDDAVIEKIEAEEKRLMLWQKLREAITLGRLGGGAIVIGLGDDASKPLPANIRPSQIQYLAVLSRWQLTLGKMVQDPASPDFGEPEYFQLSASASQATVHPSRVICFKGLPVPAILNTSWEDRFWGDSVIQSVDEAVSQASTVADSFSSLIDEAKIDVYRFGGLAETLGHADGEAKVLQRIELTNTGKSVHRAVILDKEDEWEQRQLNWAGMRDIIITYDGRVAGAADIPATRLFGKAPDGMNATGDGDLANYFQSIASTQEMDLRPPLERLDAVMLPSAGVADKGLTFKFSPLQVLSEKDDAEIENKEADTISKIVNTSLVPESALAKAVQNRLIESQRWPGLKDALDEAEVAGEELPDNDDPNEIQKVVEGGDPEASAGGGNGSPAARRAANDKAKTKRGK